MSFLKLNHRFNDKPLLHLYDRDNNRAKEWNKMNLKDAFRAQNKLQALMDEASDILQDQGNTLKVTTTHLRSKVIPEA